MGHNLLKNLFQKLKIHFNLSYIKSIGLWTAAFATGGAAVAYALLFKKAESFSHGLFSHYGIMALLISCGFFLIAWLLVHFICPEAGGSGIPQVISSIELSDDGKDHSIIQKLLSWKMILVKMGSSLLAVAGGAAVGREGPTIQISTALFYQTSKILKRVSPNINPAHWLIVGGGAGIAAAFNTPLGGIVYAIEELSFTHFNRFKISLFSSVIVAGLTAQWFLGPYLYLGFPALRPITLNVFFPTLLIASVAGICGAIFGVLLYKLASWRRSLKKFSHMLLLTLLCALTLGLVALYFEPHAIGTGKEVLNKILFEEHYQPSFILTISRFFSPIISYLSGIAGGIFAPCLGAGGSIGAFINDFFMLDYKNLYTLVGMIAFLTGVTRTPFTSFVLVLEMTDRHLAIFPMMLAALVASSAARLIDKESFYSKARSFWVQST